MLRTLFILFFLPFLTYGYTDIATYQREHAEEILGGVGIINNISVLSPLTSAFLTQNTSAPSPFNIDFTLKQEHSDVKRLQQFLNTHGFPIDTPPNPGSLGYETERFGPATMLAVKRYQEAKGITPVTGYFGPKTRASINQLLKSTTTLGISTNAASTSTVSLTITVPKGGTILANGQVCQAPSCVITVSKKAKVTLIAQPLPGYIFKKWGGYKCTNTSRTCIIRSLTQNQGVTARFVEKKADTATDTGEETSTGSSNTSSGTTPLTYTLTTSISGGGTNPGTITSSPTGINCGTTCTKDYTTGTTVTLTAQPGAGYSFVGWSGACSGTGSCITTMNSNKSVGASFAVVSVASVPAPVGVTGSAGIVSSISQYGITYVFSEPIMSCQFANGDWGVQAPVTITQITPDAITNGSTHFNGFDVNPTSYTKTPYDSRISGFNLGLEPSLPITISEDASVIKTISFDTANNSARPTLKTATILTVLKQLPSDGCVNYFRPAYFGVDKKMYSVASLAIEKLPSLAPVTGMPTLASMRSSTEKVFLDHKLDWGGRFMHPKDNMPDYGSSIGIVTNNAALRLMMNDSVSDKMPLLISYTQIGIDLYAMYKGGLTWPVNGGHMLGRELPLTFAAVMLNDQEMKSKLQSGNLYHFQENAHLWNTNQSGVVLWGQKCTESQYWNKVRAGNGARDCADPYGFVDGGYEFPAGYSATAQAIGPGDVYQFCCTAQAYKGTAIAAMLMPEVKQLWIDTAKNNNLFTFADRWVTHGAWVQGDICAPYDGISSNYGITYGPSPLGPDASGRPQCIPDTNDTDGIGRFPGQDGKAKDGGYYGSGFVNSIWSQYRASAN